MIGTTVFYTISRLTTADRWFEEARDDQYSNPLSPIYKTLEAAQKDIVRYWSHPEQCIVQRITVVVEDVWRPRHSDRVTADS